MSLENNLGKGEVAPFPTLFSTLLKNFLPFSLNLKLLSANSVKKRLNFQERVEQNFRLIQIDSSYMQQHKYDLKIRIDLQSHWYVQCFDL